MKTDCGPTRNGKRQWNAPSLIKEAQGKAKTMTYDEFAKWWDEHGAVKGGGAYEALLEMREAMRGWDSKTKRKRRNKRKRTSSS